MSKLMQILLSLSAVVYVLLVMYMGGVNFDHRGAEMVIVMLIAPAVGAITYALIEIERLG